MASTADQVIAVAAHELGMNGKHWWGNSSDSEYCRWYPLQGYWCAMFVSWCAASADALDIIPKHASTVAGRKWFIDRGQWGNGTAGIRRGDIVYFKFSGNSNVVNHVGIVESVNSDGSINTIEGNTGSGDRTGGTVARKPRSSNIVGYGRPNYLTAPTPEEDIMASITDLRNVIREEVPSLVAPSVLNAKLGSSGPTVAVALQTQIAKDAMTNTLNATLGRSETTVAMALQTEITKNVVAQLTPIIQGIVDDALTTE